MHNERVEMVIKMKHVEQKTDSVSSLTGSMRNSSIELLRLLSMIMIVASHYVRGFKAGGWGEWLEVQPPSFTKFFFYIFYLGGGWIGNMIFFSISVWFLLDRHVTVKNSFKRIWLMERELVFWGLVLASGSIILYTTKFNHSFNTHH